MLIAIRSQRSPTLGSKACQQCLRSTHLESDRHDDNGKQSADHQLTLPVPNLARCLCKKTDELVDHIGDNSIDIVIIT